ncbi:MAG TPA: hypothetical protein VK446_06235 [Methylocystis sp.]|nr:hypothetical protein [Methylocystis sp.]
MALCLAASNATAKTRIHGKTSPILKAVNEACKDRWCERGNVDDIKFDRLWCDHTSCLLSYVVHTTGSPHASRKVCRLSNIRHVQDAMQTKQGTTALSEALLADIDACFP